MEGTTVLRAGVFHLPPFISISTDLNNQTAYSGADVNLIKTVGDSLGVNVEFVTPRDGRSWGTVYPNGSTDGLFKDIVEGVVDVGAGEYFHRPLRNRFADPSDVYAFDHFCFLLSKPDSESLGSQIGKPFSKSTWTILILSWILLCLILTLIDKKRDVSKNALSTIAFLANQSLPRLSKKARFLVGTALISGSILTVSYSGNLYSFLTVSTSPDLLKSLGDLASFSGSVGNTGIDDVDMIRESKDEKVRSLAEKWRRAPSWSEGMKWAQEGHYAFMNSKISSQDFIFNANRRDLYILEECWSVQQIVLYFPKHSRLKPQFDQRIRQLREGGFINKWLSDQLGQARLYDNEDKNKIISRLEALKLADLWRMFVFLIFGLSLGSVSFVLEFVAFHFNENKT